uniref:Uncharacterized protein n=1 Tax=Romanomermis culicivorax TaxID=13658 RepID=A0A915KD61_ROMCU
MAIKTNGAQVAGITAVVGGIPAAGRGSVSLRAQWQQRVNTGRWKLPPNQGRSVRGYPCWQQWSQWQ